MHRVDADGYITVLGERRFVDRSLPTYEGTVDGANWNNAVQEEIATVIEHAGLTLRSSGAADASAGWTQLKEAIFDSGKINTASVDNISMTKLSSGNTLVDNSTFKIKSSTLATQYTLQNNFDFEAQAGDTSTYTDRQTKRSGWGDTYSRGTAVRGNADSSLINAADMSFDISAFSWIVSGDYYVATVNRETGLKWETGLLTRFAPYFATVVGLTGVPSINTLAVQQMAAIQSSGKIKIFTVAVSGSAVDPNTFTESRLYIRFSESPL